MPVERLVGLYIIDEDLYQKYRVAMTPILHSYNGDFGYDFKVSEVLKSRVDKKINRVFTIYFENENAMENFFTDEKYLIIRKKYYDPSVLDATEISRYNY